MIKRQKSKKVTSYHKASESSNDEDEETELLSINKIPFKEIPSVEKELKEGDTLQALAIRYHCTVEDLKRLNNIHKENEIHAKRTIKVPLRPITMALIDIDSELTENHSSTSDVAKSENLLLKTVSSDHNNSNLSGTEQSGDVNEIIFNTSIIPSSSVTQEQNDNINDICSSEEEVYLLPQLQESVIEPTVVSKMSCNGADCDISWVALIICICIGIVGFPLIYVLYIAEHSEENVNHHKL